MLTSSTGQVRTGVMELNELTREERIALVALLELAVEADATVSDDEVEELQETVDAIGADAYREAAAEVDNRFRDEDDLKAFLRTITRQEARELIYEAVLEAVMPDAIGAREAALLEWLAKEWSVTVRFEEPETGSGS
jgi:hypothetical protein